MNYLSGYIEELTGKGNLTIARVKVYENLFNAIVIGNREKDARMQIGQEVELLFNESEVAIGKNISGILSISNSASCKVISIENGEIFCRLGLGLYRNTIYTLVETTVCKKMDIQLHDNVEMYLKINEIFLQYPKNENND